MTGRCGGPGSPRCSGLSVADLASDPVAAIASQPVIYTRQVALQRAVPASSPRRMCRSESAHDAQERIYRALAQVVAAQNAPPRSASLLPR